MAEALTNHFFKDKIEVFSAGVHLFRVHPFAIEALKEPGVETTNLRNKHIDEFKDQEFDLAVIKSTYTFLSPIQQREPLRIDAF